MSTLAISKRDFILIVSVVQQGGAVSIQSWSHAVVDSLMTKSCPLHSLFFYSLQHNLITIIIIIIIAKKCWEHFYVSFIWGNNSFKIQFPGAYKIESSKLGRVWVLCVFKHTEKNWKLPAMDGKFSHFKNEFCCYNFNEEKC